MPRSEDWCLRDFGKAQRRWQAAAAPLPDERAELRSWARQVIRRGPPAHAIEVAGTEDQWIDWAADANAMVTYLVVDYEELVIVRSVA